MPVQLSKHIMVSMSINLTEHIMTNIMASIGINLTTIWASMPIITQLNF